MYDQFKCHGKQTLPIDYQKIIRRNDGRMASCFNVLSWGGVEEGCEINDDNLLILRIKYLVAENPSHPCTALVTEPAEMFPAEGRQELIDTRKKGCYERFKIKRPIFFYIKKTLIATNAKP